MNGPHGWSRRKPVKADVWTRVLYEHDAGGLIAISAPDERAIDLIELLDVALEPRVPKQESGR